MKSASLPLVVSLPCDRATHILNHIFGNAAHNLGPVVSEFGTEAEALSAIQQATQTAADTAQMTARFEAQVPLEVFGSL